MQPTEETIRQGIGISADVDTCACCIAVITASVVLASIMHIINKHATSS
jgi:hypothetical protein